MKKLFSILAAVFVVLTFSTALFGGDGIQTEKLAGTAIGLGVLSFVAVKANLKGVAFTAVSVNEARGILTNAIVKVYSESVNVPSFLRSFFPPLYSKTRFVSIEVERDTETIAVDVLRGTGTNLNKKTRSTQKTIEPPLYNEGSNINELDIYDVAFGTMDVSMMANLASEQARVLIKKRNKIERAYEKQCADVLQSGILTLNSQDNIDFKRKAGSMVDGGAPTYWTVGTVDPMTILENGAKFIREEGKAQGGVYNVIMGGKAYNAMVNNETFQAKYDLRQVTLGEIREPQRMATGGTLHGRVSAGSYMFNVWTYPEGYRDEAGVFNYYIEQENIIILPEVTNFATAYALVPQLPGDNANTTSDGGAYVLREYVDVKHQNHTQELLSAGVVWPVAIDTMFTAKVVAS